MRLSHSKLSKIMSCPMSYRLSYECGIWPKVERAALSIGSAVHWGIEHNTYDLQSYFTEQGSFKQGDTYTREQALAEAMVYGYLENKTAIFEQILTDPTTGEKLELVDETHELYVTGKLKSFLESQEYHEFVGIIDLLLLTDKGFVIIDYKTSTYEPDWDSYLDQIYRYIFMLESAFPDVPVVKIGIVNIRKSGIRQKKMENESQFLNRLMFEYRTNSENFVNYHEFPKADLNEQLFKDYIRNLSLMADTAQTIVDNRLFFINYGNAKNAYGKTDFYDIFYHTPNAYVLYQISDFIWDEDEAMFVDKRDCVELDMHCAGPEYFKVMNKYSIFEDIMKQLCEPLIYIDDKLMDSFVDVLKQTWLFDDNLLTQYIQTFNQKHALMAAGLKNVQCNVKYPIASEMSFDDFKQIVENEFQNTAQSTADTTDVVKQINEKEVNDNETE